MNALTAGGAGFPDGWTFGQRVKVKILGIPRWRVGGFVWINKEPATQADIDAIKSFFAQAGWKIRVDKASLVGTDDRDYTTFALEQEKKPNRIWIR